MQNATARHPLQELLDLARLLWNALLRFRWIALLAASLILVAGWIGIYRLDDLYRAEARVFVDSNQVLGPLLEGLTVQQDAVERVELMSRTLLNRPNLERLIRMTDLDLELDTPLERERLLTRLQYEIQLSGSWDNRSLYTVSYSHPDPETARRMVQAIITVFIESTLGNERADNESAQAFLDGQILEYERRLAQAESRLSEFKRENAGKMPSEAGNYYQRLDAATAQERETRLAVREAQNRVGSLRAQLAEELPTLGGRDGITVVEQQILQQRDELDQLLSRYTERHPRISQLRENIAALERRRDSGDTGPVSGGRTTTIPNPAYQQLRALLATARADMAELEVRLEDYGAQRRELENTIENIPQVEAQLAQLNRDYGIIQDQYEALLSRRESARLSEDVENDVDDVKFRVIDPPFVPSEPTSHNKALLNAALFVVAVAIGGALAFGLALLRPVFHDSRTLAARTGRPVLGVLSYVESLAERKRRRQQTALFIGSCALLLVCQGAVIALSLAGAGRVEGDRTDTTDAVAFRSTRVAGVSPNGATVRVRLHRTSIDG